MTDGPILFFDGVCNLCNRAVDYVIRRDQSRSIRFASLQGETARALLPADLTHDAMDSMVLWEDGQRFLRSDAALKVMARMGGFPAVIARLCLGLPSSLRDAAYRAIASNRYRWFGRRETCRIAKPDERDRILP
jgi:predicted DCC family thiol-disulfide oxidoreductase YuxK